MNVIVRRNDLLREVLLLQGVVNHKPSIPVLAYILIEAGANHLQFTATDLEIALRSGRCPARVVDEGSITLKADILLDFIQALPETDITIQSVGGHNAEISAERAKARLPGWPVADFPMIPALSHPEAVGHWLSGRSEAPDVLWGEDATPAVIASAVATEAPETALLQPLKRRMLCEAMNKVFAAPDYSGHHYLGGALLELTGSHFRMVSSDSKRMSIFYAPEPGLVDRALVPRKTINELTMLLAEGDEDVMYGRRENHLFFNVDGRTLVSRIIAGEFPNFDRTLNVEKKYAVDFDRERMIGAVSRVSVVSDQSKAMAIEMKDGLVRFSAKGIGGEAEEILLVDDPITATLHFSMPHVLDFLRSTTADAVRLSFNDANSPAFLKPVGETDFDYTYVLAPMR